MSSAHDLPLLNQILEAVRLVEARADGEPHLADPMVADAILWRTRIIVQATDRLSPAILARHPEVDWSGLNRLRLVADGALGGLTRDEVWLTLTSVLPALDAAVTAEIGLLHKPGVPDDRVHRVLLVDDDADIRHILDLLLTRAGFEVIEAADGVEALAQAEHSRPDAVVADVQMPRMDGVELVRRLRQRPETARTPVLLFTGKPPDDKLQGVLALDRVRYMSKGDPRKISEALEEMFDESLARAPAPAP